MEQKRTMTMNETRRGSTVVGVFEDRDRAREAIEALKEDGFTGDAISILSPDKQATRGQRKDTSKKEKSVGKLEVERRREEESRAQQRERKNKTGKGGNVKETKIYREKNVDETQKGGQKKIGKREKQGQRLGG